MNCSTCIYWIYKTERTKYVADGVHIQSRLGKCSNEVVMNSVYFVPESNFSTLNHNLLFDESFACSEQKQHNS